ncbi:U-scoloptoxin(20)-Cw1a-like [Nymphalis io]|uniref:U-scoloptoxin(20)-Cw1a-like n=1 Tax=Inachis io TaxID=171585 RepID=UPI002169365C|nr:U-scoloptoxin(20)-Cw1a-like [Nymphalis io]
MLSRQLFSVSSHLVFRFVIARNMLKITAILFLMFIGNLLAAGRSCNSCGMECAPACGTRHFRSCCFNYLRRKRDPDMLQNIFEEQDYPMDTVHRAQPYFFYDDLRVRAPSVYNWRR